jgi:uncharacterized membrane protein
VHEWLWRGGYESVGKRAAEVAEIYQSEDLMKTKELLNKYKVKYILVGEMEKVKYPQINMIKIASLGREAFAFGGTKVYEVDQ